MAPNSRTVARRTRQTGAEPRRTKSIEIAGSRWWDVWLVVLTLFPYLQTATFNFVGFDDQHYVTENTLTVGGLTIDGLWRSLFEYHMGNWHPLTMLSYMLEYSIFGATPGVYHLTNVALHAATVYLLFDWLRDATKSPTRSFAVAILFGIHPLRVESVAWISERKDVLCGLFWILSLRAYCRYVDHRTWKSFLLVCVYTVLCLLSKPMAVTLPFVMLLLDYWPLGRWHLDLPRYWPGAPKLEAELSLAPVASKDSQTPTAATFLTLVREKLIFFIISLLVGIVTIDAQDDAVVTLESMPLAERIWTPIISMVLYLDKMVRPTQLAVFYPRPQAAWSPGFLCLCALVILSVTMIAVIEIRRRPQLFVGWFWFLGVLLPVSGALQTGRQLIADRYTYLPSIGLLIAAVWSVPAFSSPSMRRVIGVLGITVIVILEGMTWSQTAHWKSTKSLFEQMIAVIGDDAMPHDMLGADDFRNGNLDSARQQFEQAIRIDSTYVPALVHLAQVAEHEGKIDESLELRQRAFAADLTTPDSGITLARFLDRRGDRDEAKRVLEAVLAKFPRTAQAYCDLGYLYSQSHEIERAMECYRKAIESDSRSSAAHMSLGILLYQRGSAKEAIPHLETALRFDPDLHFADFTLAQIFAEQGDREQALLHLKRYQVKSLRAEPDTGRERSSRER